MPPCPPRRSWPAALLLAAGFLPSVALAGSVAVPPLIASGVDAKQTHNLTSLIASELDFMSEFEGSKHLTSKPAGFGASCLGSGGCLGKVASGAGSSATIAGAVSRKSGQLDFYLVYAEGSAIVRTKEFALEDSPSALADGISAHVRELVTGQSRKAAAAAASGKVNDDAFEDPYEDDSFVVAAPVSRRIPTNSGGGSNELDDFEFDPEEDARKRAEEEERARIAAVEARQRQEAEARRQREAEEEERRRAALLLARQQEEERAAQQQEDESFEDFDLAFGGGVVSVDEAQDAARRQEEEEERRRAAAVAAAPRRDSSSSSRSPSRLKEDPDRFDEPRRYDDLDGPSSSNSRDRRSSNDTARVDRGSSSSRGGRSSSDDVSPRVTLTPHFGYSYFQSFNFITYGGELGILPTENLELLAGIDVYSTRREVPIELQEQGYPPYTWNSILPFNFGAVYKFSGRLRPYIGGDVLLIPGLVQGEGGLGTGLRVRTGLDYYVTDNFGLNANLAVGFLAGKSLEAVDPDGDTSGVTPQFTVGTVFAF